jgi:fatty acid desaturase
MNRDRLEEAVLVRHSTYVHELRPELPPEAFQPATSRLIFVPVHLVLIATEIYAIADGWLPWYLVPVLSILIGISMSGLTFVAHEAIHGAIVRGRTSRMIVGWIGFLPFAVSPRLWDAWHDRVHHATANAADDPDTYPTLEEYRTSRAMRVMVDVFAPGGRRWRGLLSLAFGFTGQSTAQLIIARRKGYLDKRGFAIALAQTGAAIGVWATVAVLVGFVPFLFAFVLPLLLANVIVMSFILTNHGLSPRVEINDPLVSGLSVTAPRWVEWMTLQFGYHVEHHLFPAMSSRHARSVRDLLRARWPQRYQSMPLGSALLALHRTARIYKDAVTLVDPRTGREFATLMPR